MSFIDDANRLGTKLHIRDMPVPLRAGLVVIGVAVLFILFQGLWQLGANETHLFDHSVDQSSWTEEKTKENQEGDLLISRDENDNSPSQDGSSSDAQYVQSPSIFVHVVGAVKAPGLYELQSGSRVKEAIDAAGGMAEGAEEGSVNLARCISDGEQIVVASKNTTGGATTASEQSQISQGTLSGNALVNINTAGVAELSTLSGIGDATAKKIIADREKNGPFKSAKDITRVSGIGDKKYESIKDSITV